MKFKWNFFQKKHFVLNYFNIFQLILLKLVWQSAIEENIT